MKLVVIPALLNVLGVFGGPCVNPDPSKFKLDQCNVQEEVGQICFGKLPCEGGCLGECGMLYIF